MKLLTRTSILTSILMATAFQAQAELKLRWTKELPPRQPSWGYVKDMQKDSGYRASAAGELAFVGCEHNGALLALDAKTGDSFMELIRKLNKDKGQTFIIVTHSQKLANSLDRVLQLKEGKLGPLDNNNSI